MHARRNNKRTSSGKVYLPFTVHRKLHKKRRQGTLHGCKLYKYRIFRNLSNETSNISCKRMTVGIASFFGIETQQYGQSNTDALDHDNISHQAVQSEELCGKLCLFVFIVLASSSFARGGEVLHKVYLSKAVMSCLSVGRIIHDRGLNGIF